MRLNRCALVCSSLLMAIAAGCGRPAVTSRTVGLSDLAAVHWRLEAIESTGVRTPVGEASPEARITLAIDGDSLVTGSAGCNSYQSRMTDLTTEAVYFGAITTTRRACDSTRMSLERRYLSILGKINSYWIFPDTLVLADSTGGNYLIYSAVAALETRPDERDDMHGYIRRLEGDFIFTELGTTREDHLIDLTGRLDALFSVLASRPEESVFVQIAASSVPRSGGAYESRQLNVHAVIRALPPEMSPQLDLLQNVIFLARGNEPFWAVRVRADSLVVLEPEQDSLVLPGAMSAIGDTCWQYKSIATGPDSQLVVLRICRSDCYDSMSGAYSVFSAELQLGGRRLTGCALRGSLADL